MRRSIPYLLIATMAVLAGLATLWSWQQAHATHHSIGVVAPVRGVALDVPSTTAPALVLGVGAWSHVSA